MAQRANICSWLLEDAKPVSAPPGATPTEDDGPEEEEGSPVENHTKPRAHIESHLPTSGHFHKKHEEAI